MPPYPLGLALDYDLNRLPLGFETRHSGAQNRVAPGELPTDGFTLVALDASNRWTLSRGNVFAFLRGEILVDDDARQHTSPLKDIVLPPGRGVRIGRVQGCSRTPSYFAPWAAPGGCYASVTRYALRVEPNLRGSPFGIDLAAWLVDFVTRTSLP